MTDNGRLSRAMLCVLPLLLGALLCLPSSEAHDALIIGAAVFAVVGGLVLLSGVQQNQPYQVVTGACVLIFTLVVFALANW
jgi:hypothetical protein